MCEWYVSQNGSRLPTLTDTGVHVLAADTLQQVRQHNNVDAQQLETL